MNVISFNTNSIGRPEHPLDAPVEKHPADIIGIAQTRAQNSVFPVQMIAPLGQNAGYQAVFHSQKTHDGVALLDLYTPSQINNHPQTLCAKKYRADLTPLIKTQYSANGNLILMADMHINPPDPTTGLNFSCSTI